MASKPYSMVDLESGYAEYLKQYKNTNDGISYWESLLMAPTKQYESSLKQATATRDYDISGAYANWKQNQLKLMQSSRLGTGVKSEIGSSLQSAYENQYAQAQQQYLSNVYSAYSDYLKGVNTAEEEIQAKAQQLANVTPMALQYYAEKHSLDYSDFNKAFYSKEDQGYGIYDYNSETGSYSLSDYGKQVFDEIFGQEVSYINKKTGEWEYNFVDWLGQQEGFEEAAKLYKSNPKLFASAIGGERSGDLAYTDEEQYADAVAEVKKSKYYNDTYKFGNADSMKSFYKQLDSEMSNFNKNADVMITDIKYANEISEIMKKYGITKKEKNKDKYSLLTLGEHYDYDISKLNENDKKKLWSDIEYLMWTKTGSLQNTKSSVRTKEKSNIRTSMLL